MLIKLVSVNQIIGIVSLIICSQVADLLHEVIVLVIELDVPATDLVFVELLLGSLSSILVVEDDQGRSGSFASGLLDVDVALINVVVLEELANVSLVNSVWETAHDQCSILVQGTDIFSQLTGHAVIIVIRWTIEVEVVPVGDD